MTPCLFTTTDSTIRDGKQEYKCVRCSQKTVWSKYPPNLIHRACGVEIDKTYPCVHRGDELRREPCPSCNGTVQVKVFNCAIEIIGECQIHPYLPNVIACSICNERLPPEG